MKYVMFTVRWPPSEGGQGLVVRIPVIFPDILVHADVARRLMPEVRKTVKTVDVEVTSAGSIDLDAERTYGVSETLGLSADPSDARVIRVYNYLHGIVT